jgi:hypothetical protein
MIAAACGVLVATAFLGSEPAEAVGAGSYCLEYNEGGTDCSFTSLSQCNETASGIGAECYAVAPQAAIQERGAMGAVPMRSRHASRNHRDGHRT